MRAENPRAHEDVARELVEVVARRIEDLTQRVAEIGSDGSRGSPHPNPLP